LTVVYFTTVPKKRYKSFIRYDGIHSKSNEVDNLLSPDNMGGGLPVGRRGRTAVISWEEGCRRGCQRRIMLIEKMIIVSRDLGAFVPVFRLVNNADNDEHDRYFDQYTDDGGERCAGLKSK